MAKGGMMVANEMTRVPRTRANAGKGDPSGSAKHQLYRDYGYPDPVSPEQIKLFFERSGVAKAAIEHITLTVWQTLPKIIRSEDGADPQERALNEHFDRINFWAAFREAHRRSLIGCYGGLILRLADGKPLDQPVERLTDGPQSLVEAVPVWDSDLSVQAWGENQADSATYGKPTMFEYGRKDLNGLSRGSVRVHPDRVLVISRDGRLDNDPELKAGFNAMTDIEKVRGAGAEGVWKAARQALVFNLAKEVDTPVAIGATSAENEGAEDGGKTDAERFADQMEAFYGKADNAMFVHGIDVKTLGTAVTGIKESMDASVSSFAASMQIPKRILVGSETGERSSAEDAKEWARVCEARRLFTIEPRIENLIGRMVEWKALDGTTAPWTIEWTPLTQDTLVERVRKSDAMARANSANAAQGEAMPFKVNEQRAALGFEPLTDDEIEEAREQVRKEDGLDNGAGIGQGEGGTGE